MSPQQSRGLFCCLFCICFISIIEAQNIDSELERLARLTRSVETKTDAKRNSFIRMAQLYRLTGDLENAALAWEKAAYADKRDYECLVESAYCFAAIGDFDKAQSQARVVMISASQILAAKARFLIAETEAFENGDTNPLIALLSEPTYESSKALIYFTIWKLAGDNSYKNRLLNEYPASPEARACQSNTDIELFPSPLWLFLSQGTQPSSTLKQNTNTGTLNLQAGLFGEEANAQALAEKIKKAGFHTELLQKTLNNKKYWAVMVDSGDNMNVTLSRLKAQGFEAFPVR